MNFWNSSLDCAAPPPEGPTPPSSAYWVHRSLSTISAHAANCKSATSPFESLPVLDDVCAAPSVANSAPADSAAPAIPRPFRNERRLTTASDVGHLLQYKKALFNMSLSQTLPQMENPFLSWLRSNSFAYDFVPAV